jgi:hypothetical protein
MLSLGDVYMCLSLGRAERVMIRWTSPSCGRELIEKWGMPESHHLYLGYADHLELPCFSYKPGPGGTKVATQLMARRMVE